MARTMDSSPVQRVRGREAELAVLGQHLDQLLQGIGSVVVVEGRAGMGKSCLLREVAAMAERLSIRVGFGGADPGDTVVQLAVLLDALFEGPSPILERTALGNTHASPEQRYWLLQDLETLLEGQHSRGPCWSASMTSSGPTTERRRRFVPSRLVWPRSRSAG